MNSVLLINTPLIREKFEETENFLPPLGLGYIATYLRKSGIIVEILDSLECNLSITDIIEFIHIKKPDFVGLNVFTPNLEIVKEIIVKMPEDITIILGAHVMKSVYNDFMYWNNKHHLIIIIGEGELILPDIIQGNVKEEPIQKTNICLVYQVTKNSIYFPMDLGKIELDREIFKKRNLINKFGLNEACMISSRGCIYQCSFCGAANKNNPDTICRIREPKNILEEINNIKRFTPEVSCIRMLDDLFLRNRNSLLAAIQIFRTVNLKWRAMAHVLTFKGNEDLLPELKKSGCLELFIGIESGSNKIRKMINKYGDLSYVFHLIRALLKYGISVKGYFMYGLPDETEDDMEKTYEFARSLHNLSKNFDGNFRNSTFQFRPYHGTELYSKVEKKRGNIKDFNLDRNLTCLKGRQQFNIVNNNCSDCEQNIIDGFITKTLRLNGD